MASINGVDPPPLNDTNYVNKINNSLNAIDAHDHTSGKGVQLQTAALADGSVTNAKIANSTIDLTAKVTGALPIVNGGTGQTGAAAAFDALAPTTTAGDLIARGASSNVRVAGGTDGQVLTYDNAEAAKVKWAAPAIAPDDGNDFVNVGLAVSVGSNAMTIALKQKDGVTDASSGSPVGISFRSATITSGAFVKRLVTSSLSVTISSGSTVGTVDGTNAYIYVYAIDNAGTVELAFSQTRQVLSGTVSTTAEGGVGGADSASALYSTTARSNVAIRLLGRLLVNQTTAGSWTSAPTEIVLAPYLSTISEKIEARMNWSDGSHVSTATWQTINATVVEAFDNFNALTSSGVFTAPATRKYRVSAGVTFGVQVTGVRAIRVLLDNTGDAVGQGNSAAANAEVTASFNTIISMIAGQTLNFETFQNSGSTLAYVANPALNWICIESID